MKKIFSSILVLGLLLSGNAYAETIKKEIVYETITKAVEDYASEVRERRFP